MVNKMLFYWNPTLFIWNISKIHFLAAILDAILNFSMKNPDPDLTPKPESLPIVSSSTLNYQTFSVEGVERIFFLLYWLLH